MTTIDYYFAPVSPWAYLGHARFVQIAKAAGARVQFNPIDLGAVFPISGGLPLPKRAPQRQAYRLVELKRFSEHLGIPLNVQPKHFPAPGDEGAKLILPAGQLAGTDAAPARNSPSRDRKVRLDSRRAMARLDLRACSSIQ